MKWHNAVAVAAFTQPVLACVLAAAVSVGCDRLHERRYALMGVVQARDADNGKFLVAHGDIPGFMPAMTMPFTIKGSPEPRPGDRIEAVLVVRESDSWLERIEVKERGLAVTAPQSAGRPAAIGTELPDLPLIDQDGRAIHLGQYRGKTLAVTFIYTRCPIPEFCPFLMRAFMQLHAALAREPALLDRTHLLTVSFDPGHDTPAVLRQYAAPFIKDQGRGRFAHWQLATGSAQQVKDVARFFGMEYWGDGADIAHSLRTGIVGPDGKLRKVYEDNNWSVADAVAAMRAAGGEKSE